MTEDPINQPPSEPVDISVTAPADLLARDNGNPAEVQAAGVVTTTVASVEKQVIQREVVFPLPNVDEIQYRITDLRDAITRLVPAQDALKKLEDIRMFADVKRLRRRTWFLRFFTSGRYYERFEYPEESLTERLDEIDRSLPVKKEDELRSLERKLQRLGTDVGIKMRHIKSSFIGLVYSITTSKELVEDLVQKIGPRELRDEAKMHLGIVEQLVKRLKSDDMAIDKLNVLSDNFQGAIGIMIELEQRRNQVEELVYKDRTRRQWTVAFVIAYIALVLALAIFVGVRWGGRFFIGDTPLSTMKLPLVGIPWPVIVWSLIGSFAAMIYRFNKKPIYDFGDAVKWMLTRPVQGVVLGAAFYLVLISGLFLLGGRATPENPASHTNDVILILSFLVGFSDRFADSVFNAIVDKYSHGGDSSDEPRGKNKKGRNDPGSEQAAT